MWRFRRRDRAQVVVVDDEPAAGAERVGELGDHHLPLRQVLQHEPGRA
jgi:hypothetical protein